ncbi:sulfotransferase [Synechococcus sp. HB1133]|uniref:sulfotransferase n=1 Tax=unclassified Synechococcus TaxID=2626047 RepID=UPI001407897F|nr:MULTISPECIES: sulfotransferase [unclassified Synechococcus]MCB4393888.1 sulfotransferase [Synechococcus sp. PH41509]MCB4421368.1 sulfotransferase [Synechococcus sp. HB1133]MCB4431281.1 sulfotransferase [Synechococcus sp. HBA1120]NHI80310.1 sulfotransferase [Synechococcus sp. HB1133]
MTSKRLKLLLIRGLGHSGTTMLDLALGAHPQIIGLGEAARILETPKSGDEHRGPSQLRGPHRFERRCTCGAIAAECPIWGPQLDWLLLHDHMPMQEKVKRLLKGSPHDGGAVWHVDSYQDDLEMTRLSEAMFDIRIIHLVRDVRSWVHSRARAARKSGLRWPAMRQLARWWRVNAKFERSFWQSPYPVFHLGYEEFALQPQRSLELLCAWLSIDFQEAMLAPGQNSSSHILAGNRVRFDAERSRTIAYDGAWLGAPAPTAADLGLLLPNVARMNRRLVYSNGLL